MSCILEFCIQVRSRPLGTSFDGLYLVHLFSHALRKYMSAAGLGSGERASKSPGILSGTQSPALPKVHGDLT